MERPDYGARRCTVADKEYTMLIQHVQVRTVGDRTLHVQATGPAFPTGYASGDLQVSEAKYNEVIQAQVRDAQGSLRPGSNARYAVCSVNGEDVGIAESTVKLFTVSALVQALNAPSPSYSKSDASTVGELVAQRVKEASTPKTKPAPAPAPKLNTKTAAKAIAEEFCLNKEAAERIEEMLDSFIA